jgi:hypothetical protein
MIHLSPVVPEAGEAGHQDATSRQQNGLAFFGSIEQTGDCQIKPVFGFGRRF